MFSIYLVDSENIKWNGTQESQSPRQLAEPAGVSCCEGAACPAWPGPAHACLEMDCGLARETNK